MSPKCVPQTETYPSYKELTTLLVLSGADLEERYRGYIAPQPPEMKPSSSYSVLEFVYLSLVMNVLLWSCTEKITKYNKMLVGCIMYNLISYCVAFDGSIGVCWRFPVHSDGWRIKRICTKTFRYPRSWKRKQWRVEQLKWCCGKLWDACCRQGECATIEMTLKKIIACETNFSTQIVLNVK